MVQQRCGSATLRFSNAMVQQRYGSVSSCPVDQTDGRLTAFHSLDVCDHLRFGFGSNGDRKVAKWWIPDDVVFVDELPHTATGKLLKTKLREDFKNYELPTV